MRPFWNLVIEIFLVLDAWILVLDARFLVSGFCFPVLVFFSQIGQYFLLCLF